MCLRIGAVPSMTEQEIRTLITEHTTLIIMCTQIWLTITSAFVVVSYVAGKDLGPHLRKLLAILYIVFALSPLVNWLVTYNEVRQLAILLSASDPSYSLPPGMFYLGRGAVVFQVFGFVVGTFGSLAYFYSTRHRNGT